MRKVLVCLALVLCATSAFAQWRRGSLSGADVRALIVDPAHPDRLFLGTSGGDVYVSNDGAKTWTPPRNGVPFPGYVVDNLVVDRKGRLWAACWGVWGGGVIAVSDDGGRTWVRRDHDLEDESVRAIAIDAHDANFLVAGGLTGVWRSRDSGQSWQKISDQINVESLAIDPRDHNRIYVGTWRQGLRTDDGGRHWKLINAGMVLDTDMFGITFEPDNPDSLWVSTCGWVYNSNNRGEVWTRYRDGFNNRRIHDVQVNPCDHDSLFAGSVAGLYRTDDRGKSWYLVSDEGLVIKRIALHPQRPNRIVLGVEGDGVYVSEDAGKTFARASEGLRNMSIANVVADPAERNRVYASVMFGGAASGIYVSNDGGGTWEKLSTTKLPEVLSLTVAEDSKIRFVAGTEKGFFWSRDGKDWTQAAPANFPIRVEKIVRFNQTRSFAATSEGVFTTRDGGKSWYRLAGSDNRTVDLAIGALGERRALYALTTGGVMVFDGEKWANIDGAPDKGHTLAIRSVSGGHILFVAGAQGVRAGRVDDGHKWHSADAPDAQYAAVFGSARSNDPLLFLTSRNQHEILVGEPQLADWLSLSLPTRNAEITSIAPDPFDADRFYVGTLHEGVFIYEGQPQKYVAAATAQAATSTQ